MRTDKDYRSERANEAAGQSDEAKRRATDANQPAGDDEDTEYGGGAADDDTSAGYGMGAPTGNSSDADTGLDARQG